MFSKLVKHEFRATRRVIPFVFLLTVFIAGMMTVSVALNLEAIVGITMGLLIIMLIAEVIITYALIVWRYYKTMCGNEAYLSHTLPVKPHLLMWSKFLVSFVWVAISYLVLAACMVLLIIIFAKGTGTTLAEIFDQLKIFWQAFGLRGHEVTVIVSIIGLFILSIVSGLTQIFFSVSLGSTSKLHKYGIGGPILVYVVLYFVLQIVSMAAMALVPLAFAVQTTEAGELSFRIVSRNMLEWFIETIRNGEPVSNAGLVGIGSYLILPVLVAVLLYATARIVDRHTSVR
ncbi:MAG: hypothetical protein JW817_03845 [Clostridiales bacterium]|nr:hypothetical protein [Clostridiales bacterium]